MSKIHDLHEKAMNLCDEAFFAKRKGDMDSFMKFSHQALEFETEAANLLKDNFDDEPSRSILYRSAASIAIDCKELRQAEKLIAMALVGNPPNEIAEELRDLLEKVHFSRHLELKNVDLTESEMQMSMIGDEVGFGTVLMESFIDRVKDFERIIYRTVERLENKVFRERGSTDRTIQESYCLYMKAIRAQSFAVTLQLGKQMKLPGMDLSSDVVDEVIDCFQLINSGNEEELKRKIPQEPYYLNFINLAKRIAPDGEKVSMVGLTKIRGKEEIKLAFTKKRKEIVVTAEINKPKKGEDTKPLV
ncbi:MAG: hypothetical protein MUC29_06575, partial [Pyrinomonadaceae bacterium]|nr:hypothetical protein [Pyrinomonadaceae bacterium]